MKSDFFYVLRFVSYEYKDGERICVCNDEILDFESFDQMISQIHIDLIRPGQIPFSLVHFEMEFSTIDHCIYYRVVLDFNEWCSMLKRSFQYALDKQRIEDECNS